MDQRETLDGPKAKTVRVLQNRGAQDFLGKSLLFWPLVVGAPTVGRKGKCPP